jgi:hypothetical protein
VKEGLSALVGLVRDVVFVRMRGYGGVIEGGELVSII